MMRDTFLDVPLVICAYDNELATRSPCANFLRRYFLTKPLGSRPPRADRLHWPTVQMQMQISAPRPRRVYFLPPEARRYRSRWCEQSCYISSYVEIMVITGAYGVRYFHISHVRDIGTFIYAFLYYLSLECNGVFQGQAYVKLCYFSERLISIFITVNFYEIITRARDQYNIR